MNATPPIDAAILAVMQELRDAVLGNLTTAGGKTPKRVITAVPGTQIVWDDCCDGLLGIRMAGMRPRLNDTARANLRMPCSILYWDVDLEVSLLRCAAVVNDAGVAPSAAVLSAEGQSNLTDLRAVLQAVKNHPLAYSVSPVQPQGPQGGCGGWAITTTVRINDEPCGDS